MKHSVILSFAALMALSASATPALAWGNHYDHYDNYSQRGYYAPQEVVYAQPVNRAVYQQQSYYQPATVQSTSVHCGQRFNPLTGILGGALGGVAGNGIGKGHGRTAAIITGAVLGTAIGGSAGGDDCVQQVAYPSPPVAQPVYVSNASSQAYNYDDNQGRYCREYQNRSTVGGRVQETYGTACMQPDGSWEIVN